MIETIFSAMLYYCTTGICPDPEYYESQPSWDYTLITGWVMLERCAIPMMALPIPIPRECDSLE